MEPVPDDPLSHGHICPVGERALSAQSDPRRLTGALQRVSGRLEPANQEHAIREIAHRIEALRNRHGPDCCALYLGPSVALDGWTMARAVLLGASLGTPNLFSADEGATAWIHATAHMLGHPMVLHADLLRADHILLLGAPQESTHWGPLQGGHGFLRAIGRGVQANRIRLSVADPCASPATDLAGTHLRLVPGTELFLLLGMLHAVLRGGWMAEDFVQAHTEGIERLRALVSPWDPPRCARICGLSADELTGEALRFARAPRAVAIGSPQAFGTPRGTLTAWAILALSTITANTLRPGGLFDATGTPPLAALVRAAGALQPRPTTTGRYPRPLGTASDYSLLEELGPDGQGQLRALVCIGGDPLSRLPAPRATGRALEQLDLLVCLDHHLSATARRAHWVLPTSTFLERADPPLFLRPLAPDLPAEPLPAVVEPPADVRPCATHLAMLQRHLRLPRDPSTAGLLRALAWSMGLLGHQGASRLSDRLTSSAPSASSPAARWRDRAAWRVSRSGGRIQLVPPAYVACLESLVPPEKDPTWPLQLITRRHESPAPSPLYRSAPPAAHATLHPRAVPPGAGDRLIIRTRHGSLTCPFRTDRSLHPATVVLPADDARVNELLPVRPLDPFTGAAWTDGLPARAVLPGGEEDPSSRTS